MFLNSTMSVSVLHRSYLSIFGWEGMFLNSTMPVSVLHRSYLSIFGWGMFLNSTMPVSVLHRSYLSIFGVPQLSLSCVQFKTAIRLVTRMSIPGMSQNVCLLAMVSCSAVFWL